MSDQDFFFDEDEQPTQAAPAKKSAPARPQAASTPATQNVSMAVASLIGVIALLAGVIVGILLPIGNAPAGSTGTPVQTTAPGAGGAGGGAPQLSDEQIQSGELPAGHPDIGAMGGAESSETTPAK